MGMINAILLPVSDNEGMRYEMLIDRTRDWMLENGFEPHKIDARGEHSDTALILASRRGEVDRVRDLLDAGADINLRNMDGANALWAACVADSYPVAELLLQRGVDINNQNENGATVLMDAASNGRTEWVNYLLGAGADIRLRSLDDYSALDLAGNIVILRLLKNADKHQIAESEIGC
jgi:ankyrin repeat protein